MGSTAASIDALRSMDYQVWLAEQMQAPVSSYLGYLDGLGRETFFGVLHEKWLLAATSGPDQLRQRTVNALMEILVTSALGLGGDGATPRSRSTWTSCRATRSATIARCSKTSRSARQWAAT